MLIIQYHSYEKDDQLLIPWIGGLKSYKNPFVATKIYLHLNPIVRKTSKLLVDRRGELEDEVRREVSNVGGEYFGYINHRKR